MTHMQIRFLTLYSSLTEMHQYHHIMDTELCKTWILFNDYNIFSNIFLAVTYLFVRNKNWLLTWWYLLVVTLLNLENVIKILNSLFWKGKETCGKSVGFKYF